MRNTVRVTQRRETSHIVRSNLNGAQSLCTHTAARVNHVQSPLIDFALPYTSQTHPPTDSNFKLAVIYRR